MEVHFAEGAGLMNHGAQRPQTVEFATSPSNRAYVCDCGCSVSVKYDLRDLRYSNLRRQRFG